jgi:hypothetical protein
MAVRWLVTWWRERGERRRGALHDGGHHGCALRDQRCSVCAGFESAIWELQQRSYPTTTTEQEYRLHRLQRHPVSQEHAGPQPLTYTRIVVDNDAA